MPHLRNRRSVQQPSEPKALTTTMTGDERVNSLAHPCCRRRRRPQHCDNHTMHEQVAADENRVVFGWKKSNRISGTKGM